LSQEAENARLQSGLPYRHEAKISEAISRLQHQLQMQNFKLNEEKKIVAEIDTLKRSKKDLGQVPFYISLRASDSYSHAAVLLSF